MAHTHEQDRTTFYVAQLSTIGICGMVGVVSILLYKQNILNFMLATNRQLNVFLAGIVLLVIVALRAIVLFASAGRSSAAHQHDHDHCHGHDCDHDHEHGHDHDHDHDHGHDHNHEHAHDHAHDGAPTVEVAHDHGHGHDHDHGWNPWRYIILLLPIVLYFLDLPNAGFSAAYSKIAGISAADLNEDTTQKYASNTGLQITKVGATGVIKVVKVIGDSPAQKAGIKANDVISQVTLVNGSGTDVIALKDKSLDDAAKLLGGRPETTISLAIQREGDEKPQEVKLTRALDVMKLEFRSLEQAAYTAEQREHYSGRIVQVKGQFRPGSDDHSFSLVRYKINCCAADAIPLNVVIRLDPKCKEGVRDVKALQWVDVTGQVQFLVRRDQPGEYVTVLTVAAPADIQETAADSNPYLQ